MKTSSVLSAAFALTLAVSFNLPFSAIAAEEVEKSSGVAEMKPADAAAMSAGEVKKIDKETGKITIKHGPLVNLDMPPMTMVFRVKDPAMLDQVKPGDKINFVVEKANGALTVTQIQAGS
ncbi:Cu and Ag efflux protein CusF [Collimonas sp. OK242]|uniref:copper-binding protein n=1 Tax=Collimonas sp. OK242 TaxID=1798195 RepID=UPI00089CFD7E|nr:copper-binding protein [Collimonas sp. OK242]SDY87326.1 Cu and Ag efflux protein CusF [Collimonas sp. OK242]